MLPGTLGYDLLLCPFVLYLVVLGGALAADGLGSGSMSCCAQRSADRGGHGPGVTARQRTHRPRVPRHGRAAARIGDGWVGGAPARPRVLADAGLACGTVLAGQRAVRCGCTRATA